MIAPVLQSTICLFAISEAWRDADRIARHLPIRHGLSLLFRAAVSGVFIACASVLHWIAFRDLWFLIYIPMSWALWTICFRLTLNHEHRKPWHYLGPVIYLRVKGKDSWYDGLWHRLAFAIWMNLFDDGGDDLPRPYPAHWPGAMAYGFEGSVLIASVIATTFA